MSQVSTVSVSTVSDAIVAKKIGVVRKPKAVAFAVPAVTAPVAEIVATPVVAVVPAVEVIPAPVAVITPAPAVTKAPVAEKAPLIVKAPKTLLPDGFHYSLLSRVRNAFSANAQATMESAKGDILTLVDGRGQTQKVHSCYVDIAQELGAKWLSENRTSHVKKVLTEKGFEL